MLHASHISSSGDLLVTIHSPADLKPLDFVQLNLLAQEIRSFLVEKVSANGGHLGPNLGVVELTLALHRIFDSPKDTILWDTGHQAYVHKILTGRQAAFDSLRQKNGLSGYPSRAESKHDFIENSHASTVLSYADGLAKAHQLRHITDRHIVAVIGDGALTGGLAWEALNNISAAKDRPLIIVINDNGRSYAPTVGGLAKRLATLRDPELDVHRLFEDLSLKYIGPVDGHDLAAIESALGTARSYHGPVIVHCITNKGQGYEPAEVNETDHLHAVEPINPATGQPLTVKKGVTWTDTFGDEMVKIGARRSDVVAVTAAMLEPVGLGRFAKAYPDRVFDVGLAEQHAVISAAGLALGGMHPVVAMYATFLGRAFDQVLMDVALHQYGVTLVFDRAGVTGSDGASHNGMWDLSILQIVPSLRLAAPRDGLQLREQLREAVATDNAPTALRFPKGDVGKVVPAIRRSGGIDLLWQGDPPADVLIIAVGAMAEICLGAAKILDDRGVAATVVDPRWIMPVNPALGPLASTHRLVVTVEDNVRVSGAGAAITQWLADSAVTTPVRNLGLPMRFLHQASRSQILEEVGLTPSAIAVYISRSLQEL